jgi:hypothetical protein
MYLLTTLPAVPPPSESSLRPPVARLVLSQLKPRAQMLIQVRLEPLVVHHRSNPRYLEGLHPARLKANLRVRTSQAYLGNSSRNSPLEDYSDPRNPLRAGLVAGVKIVVSSLISNSHQQDLVREVVSWAILVVSNRTSSSHQQDSAPEAAYLEILVASSRTSSSHRQ